MTSQAPGAASTASNLNNPFLNDPNPSNTFTSTNTAPYAAGAGSRDDPLATSSDSSAFSSSRGLSGVGGTSSGVGIGSGTNTTSTASDLRERLSSTASAAGENIRSTVDSASANASRVSGEDSLHAGSLAPSESTVAPEKVPEGTEHVSNILTGIAGAVLSAPAAALEAVSPKAAAKASDGVAFISSKLPAVSLDDVTNTTKGVAASAYNAVPEGTAATLQQYAGAAIAKAQEVLPPALGGSTTKGNTGEGDLAKPPSQLASEYGNTASENLSSAGSSASQSISNAANAAVTYVQQALGTAKQTASDAAATTQHKASELSQAASQKASEASQSASQTTSDLSNRASATASDLSSKASETASSYTSSARDTAPNYADRTSSHGSNNFGSTTGPAGDASSYSRATGQAGGADVSLPTSTSSYSAGSTLGSSGRDAGFPSGKQAGLSAEDATFVGRKEMQPGTTLGERESGGNVVSSDIGGSATQSHGTGAAPYEYTQDELNNPKTTL